MPLRARAPATEENRPGRSGAATMTWGGCSETDGSPERAHLVDELLVRRHDAVRRGWLCFSLEHAVGAIDEVGDEAGLPGAPGGRAGRPAVGLGQCRQQMEGQPVADGLCDTSNGRGIVEVASGGGVRQQEVLADEVDQHGDVGWSEPHARRDAVDDLDPDGGVIAREPLADVVQEGTDEEKVRPFDGVGELGRQCGGFQEVTIDGVGVVGVALGFVANGRPFGDQPD